MNLLLLHWMLQQSIKQNAQIDSVIRVSWNICFDIVDVADIYDVLRLLQSFQSRKTSASTDFLTYCGHSGPRKSQNWSCLALVLSPAQVVLYAGFLTAIQICLLSSACFLGSLVVCRFARFSNFIVLLFFEHIQPKMLSYSHVVSFGFVLWSVELVVEDLWSQSYILMRDWYF